MSRAPRDGKVIEELGHYDPLVPDTDARALLNGERIAYWLSVGAQPSENVQRPDQEVRQGRHAPGRSSRRPWSGSRRPARRPPRRTFRRPSRRNPSRPPKLPPAAEAGRGRAGRSAGCRRTEGRMTEARMTNDVHASLVIRMHSSLTMSCDSTS